MLSPAIMPPNPPGDGAPRFQCSTCGGSGIVAYGRTVATFHHPAEAIGEEECPTCGGNGWVATDDDEEDASYLRRARLRLALAAKLRRPARPVVAA